VGENWRDGPAESCQAYLQNRELENSETASELFLNVFWLVEAHLGTVIAEYSSTGTV
jgi:hypothetical protein